MDAGDSWLQVHAVASKAESTASRQLGMTNPAITNRAITNPVITNPGNQL